MRAGRRGITLLEMLFATGLFAVMMSLVYGSYVYCARTIQRCQDGYEPFRDGIKLQMLLSRMLASASPAKQRNAKATFEGDESRISFTTLNRQGFDPEHPWPLAYVRITGVRDEGLTIVSHPTWFLSDKEDAETGVKLSFPTVSSVKFEYQDGRDWVREWDASKKGKLPRSVRLGLKLKGPKTPELSWVIQVPLNAQSELPIVGGVAGGPNGAGPLPGQPGFTPQLAPPGFNQPPVFGTPPPGPGTGSFTPGNAIAGPQ